MSVSEKDLNQVLKQIVPPGPDCGQKARLRIAQLTMPYWAMGRVLDLAVELCSMTGELKPSLARKTVFVMAGDHGVAQEGVSLYPPEVTVQMLRNFVSGGAAINVLSRKFGARTVIVDAGVNGDLSSLVRAGQIVGAKIGHGTRNFAHEPAMTRLEALQSVMLGVDLARSYAADTDVFATGDMGIGNTSSSTAIAAILTAHPVESIVGRGTGVDDAKLAHKTRVIEKALALHQPDPNDALDILSKVGGFEIGAIAGLILGAASLRKPVLVDGFISTAAALLSQAFCPASSSFMIASHASAERGHGLMWKKLGKAPLLDLGMRLGEGSGAVLAMPLLDAAIALMSEMATFEDAQISTQMH